MKEVDLSGLANLFSYLTRLDQETARHRNKSQYALIPRKNSTDIAQCQISYVTKAYFRFIQEISHVKPLVTKAANLGCLSR